MINDIVAAGAHDDAVGIATHSRKVSGRASGGTIQLTCGARIASPSVHRVGQRDDWFVGHLAQVLDDRISQAAKALDLDFDDHPGLSHAERRAATPAGVLSR